MSESAPLSSATQAAVGSSARSISASPSGGNRRTTLSPACTVSIFSARSASSSFKFGTLHLGSKHQPLPAHLLDDVAVLVLERGQTLLQP